MRILMITNDGYDDAELLYPYYRIAEEGHTAEIAAPEQRLLTGKHYFTVMADRALSQVNPGDYDALLLPGGRAPEKLRLLPEVTAIVRDFFADNRPVAAICHGQQLLISAGVLRGRRATCYPGIRDDLINAGAEYADAPVVTDGNLITSRRPEDLPLFMRSFLSALGG